MSRHLAAGKSSCLNFILNFVFDTDVLPELQSFWTIWNWIAVIVAAVTSPSLLPFLSMQQGQSSLMCCISCYASAMGHNCAADTQTCSLIFLLYFKGMATNGLQYVNQRFFSPFYLFIGPCWQPRPSRCQRDQRRKGELGWDAWEAFGHTFVNSSLGPLCWKRQGCWPNIYFICV